MKPKLKKIFYTSAAFLFLSGCGDGHSHFRAGQLVFKGEVVKVDYMLTRGITILVDAEGKTTELSGFPGIPCAEVEIYNHGDHEYEVFLTRVPFGTP